MFRRLLRVPIVLPRSSSCAFSDSSAEAATSGGIPELVLQHRPNELASSRKSRILRKNGQIPGVIYGFGKEEKVSSKLVSISKKLLMDQLRAQGKSFENTVYTLRIEGEDKTYQALPRQTQFSPLTDMPINVNFLIRRPENVLRIPIDFINEENNQDLKRGSYVVRVNQFLQCTCDGEIPRNLTIDLGNAPRGAVFKISDLQLPPNVRPAKNVSLDLVVCVIKSARAK